MAKRYTNKPSLQGTKQSAQYRNIVGFCYSASLEDAQKQDYKLTPGIYVGTETVEDDGLSLKDKMETLKAQLEVQFIKGDELQQQVLENFKKF
jgi:type I restriction enzyme M protein